jgi:P27 family predicted phage terminase small subunit
MGIRGPNTGAGNAGRPRKTAVRRPSDRKPKSSLVPCDGPDEIATQSDNLPVLHDSTPAALGDVGRDAWNELRPLIPGFNRHLDTPALTRFCELLDERASYRAALAEHGALLPEPVITPKGETVGTRLVANPAEAMLRRVDKALDVLTVQLALSPASRVRLGLNLARGGETAAYLIAEMSHFNG